jgi:2-C-methyl-D-erythritol 4-phosphate cytidylyltransferase
MYLFMSFNKKTIAILVAGGVGSRYKQSGVEWGRSKVWVVQNGITMLEHSLEQLLPVNKIDEIYIIFDRKAEKEFYTNAELSKNIGKK